MRVLLLSASDIRGGAAKVAHILATGLAARGVDVELHATHCVSGSPFVRPVEEAARRRSDFTAKLAHRFGMDGLRLDSAFPFSMGAEFFRRFDVIHMHDPPAGFNFSSLPWLAGLRPLVWTLHCMQPFTGGCLYSYDCGRFTAYCGRCPQFGRWPLHWMRRDGSRGVNLLKRAVFSLTDFVPVGVSNYILREAQRGMLARHAGVVVPNPVDLNALRPADKRAAKAALGIPPDRFTILFAVAGNLQDTRKGLDTILEALPRLRAQRPFLIPTGVTEPDEAFVVAMRGFDGLAPRHLQGDAELAAHYQAADVVWHPTRADTSTMVGLEAMACGTPVIAAAVGGVSEIVRDGVNGVLVPPSSPRSLAEATQRLISDHSSLRELGAEGRRWVAARHGISPFINRHIRLYERLSTNGTGNKIPPAI
ncbi:MAG: glycosyltransferase [Opitutales bacterium]|nr:glycosyltransferase [Opitutales bacterium]